MQKNVYKFLLVGIGAFAIDYGLTLVLHYQFGVVSAIASGVGFITGFGFSFGLNKKWTFRPKTTYTLSTKKQISLYLLLAIINLFVSSFLVGLFDSLGVVVWLGKGVTIALIASWNFILSRYVIFTESKSKD